MSGEITVLLVTVGGKRFALDAGGSFAYRWECVLRRLDQTDVDALIEAIREHIWVLNSDRKG